MEPVEGQGSPHKVLDRLFKTTKSSTIPHLTELRKALGYGNPGQEQDIAFKRAIRAQIESFVSPSTKIPAYKLTKWRLPLHQRGLQEVTKDFLDTKGKGPEFWPARHDSVSTRCLEYPKDSSRIRRLMIKVFWRAAREYKRNKPSNSTTTKLPSQPSDRDTLPLKPLDTPTDDKRQVLDNNSHILKGQNIDNPIDVESMQSRTNTSGLSTDDRFAGLGIAFNFILGAQRQDTPDESSCSEPFSSSQLVPDTEGTMMPIPEEVESASGTDLYEVPPSPPEVTETARINGKRPVEPDSDDLSRQAKVPRQDPSTSAKSTRQPPKSARGGRKTQSLRPKVRSSKRQCKPVYRPGAATEEQIQAAENPTPTPTPSPPPAVSGPQRRSNASQSKQPSTTTNDSTSRMSAGETQGQSPTGAIRAELARQAERQTTEAAIAAGVDQELDARGTSTADLSAKAQGKLPEVPVRRTPTVQAGPSREREAESTVRPEASAVSQQRSRSGNLEPQDTQRQVPHGHEIVIVIRSDIANGVDFMSWKPSSFLFNMSLADVAEELGLRQGRTLHMSLRGRISNLCEKFEPGDEDGFESFIDECLGVIMQRHSGAASTPVLQRQQFRIYFSDKPISI
ncbi:hypothetical protein FPANT_3079 [Fusarium pseudoanthophilum]|uniref:Uncharacterized protein n=1 Tax=Fusarium pseudoanthophilum TaxID=48495 RepID=A0A8H5PMP9_9HYPO|nr:hypothetical protein FPANT_3079 [Fusarium pseudoanthophilum]